jgi:hypothetical protein
LGVDALQLACLSADVDVVDAAAELDAMRCSTLDTVFAL